MKKVFSAMSVSVDGFITGRNPRDGHGIGDGDTLFDWYTSGDVPSTQFGGFHLSDVSAKVFDGEAARAGAVVVGRNTYEDSGKFGGGSPHPTAPMVLLSSRPAPELTDAQTLVDSGIEDAIAAAAKLADGKDVALMGGGVVTSALEAGLLDEFVLHQVPVLLGAGRPFFQALPRHIELRLADATAAPGVTHLRYEVVR